MTSRLLKSKWLRPGSLPARREGWGGVLCAGLLIAAAAFVLACSDDDDASNTGATASTTTSATTSAASSETTPASTGSTAASGETRVIQDFFGEVEVPVNPQRVVAADSPTLGNILALDVKPVATGVNVNSLPFYLQDKMEGVENIQQESGIDLERALALNADLIIGFGGSVENPFGQENCELYAQALPTFCYEYWYAYEEEIKKNFTEIARALNREDKAEEVLAAYDARIEELKQKVIEVGFNDKPITVVRVFDDGTYSVRIGTTESIIFRDIGIPQPAGQQNPDDFSIDLSLENLNLLNEAYAVLIYIDDNSTVKPEEMLSNDVWKTLTPVQEDRVVFVNSGVWNSIDMLGAMAVMDDIENLVLPLAEGE